MTPDPRHVRVPRPLAPKKGKGTGLGCMRLFMIPHLLIGIGILAYTLFLATLVFFGEAVEGTVTGTSSTSDDSGTSYSSTTRSTTTSRRTRESQPYHRVYMRSRTRATRSVFGCIRCSLNGGRDSTISTRPNWSFRSWRCSHSSGTRSWLFSSGLRTYVRRDCAHYSGTGRWPRGTSLPGKCRAEKRQRGRSVFALSRWAVSFTHRGCLSMERCRSGETTTNTRTKATMSPSCMMHGSLHAVLCTTMPRTKSAPPDPTARRL